MKTEVSFESSAAIYALADRGFSPEVRALDAGDVESRRGHTKSGKAFFIEADDPWRGHFELYAGEPVPGEIEALCSTRASFLLRLPTGRLSVCALGVDSTDADELPEMQTSEVPPGDYQVSVLDRPIENPSAITAQHGVAPDDADWRLFERVNHFGAAGCLSLALGMLFVLIPHTRREYWFLLPLFLLPTCAFIVLRHLPGYARASKQAREHSEAPAPVVVSMQQVESTRRVRS